MTITRLAVSTAVIALLAPRGADAQEHPGSGYAMGGVAVTYESGVTHTGYETYVSAPGGATWGGTFGGGVFLTGRMSVEGEVSRTGMMNAREPSRYNTTYVEERRDWFFAGNFRFHLRPGSHADIEPIAGVLVTHHQAWSQTEYTPPPGLPSRVFPRIAVDLPTTLGLNSGIDVRLGGRHVAVVPSFRFRWRFAVFGDNRNFGWYPDGLPTWTLSPAVVVRVHF